MAKGMKTGGRQKGTPNRLSAALKDDILNAAEAAGGEGGTVAYLTEQARSNPTAFLTLLGKVLPMQVTGEGGGPVNVMRIERVIVDPRLSDNTGQKQCEPLP